ncbi:MAG: ATP-binding protein, partial [Rhodospirillaceae bacterium]
VRRQEAENEVRVHEQKLAQAQKMETVGQLTGGLAHDFNNLLTVIKGASEDLMEETAAVPHLAAQVKMIQQATSRGVDLVRQLMAFSRKQELNPAAVDLNALLETTASLLRKAVPETIAIAIERGADLPAVFVDSGTLENVILNLAMNARDAMPDGGTLAIATSTATLDDAYAADQPEVKPGLYVQLSVCDTGSGMPEEVVARAFDPFFTTKESGKGTGLGLSMVYGFVKQSGGHVRIYSEAGHGTAIKIYLPPMAGAVLKAAAPEAPAANRGQAATAARILLVEDDDLVRSSVEIKLLRLGHAVTPVSNPGLALEALEGGAGFDLVFTDIIMPGPMTGADLARVVMERWPAIKILATSGYTESTLLGKITVPAGVRLLSKPYANTDLIAAIEAVLGGAETKRRA